MKSLTWERHYPFAVAVCAGAASCFQGLEMTANAPALLSATVTFGAVASGFVGTSLSILTSLDTPAMQKVRATSYLDILREYLGWALAAGIALSSTGLAGLFLDLAPTKWFGSAWCLVLAFCISCLWRLGKMMLLVFSDRRDISHRE